jgi:CheY-like chemotaxis protein
MVSVRRRVLIVDDVRDAADSLSMLVNLFGHEACVAYDGDSALKAATEFDPDTALIDIALPRMDGYRLAAHLLEKASASLLLVAITGYGREEDKRRSKEAGFRYHLVKPIDCEELRHLLANDSPGSSERLPR